MYNHRDYEMARQLVEERARAGIRAQQLQREFQTTRQAQGKQWTLQMMVSRMRRYLATWGTGWQRHSAAGQPDLCCASPGNG